MTKSKSSRIPKLRHHKATGQALVELNGRRIYLGRHGTAESQGRYHELIAEWVANGRTLPVAPLEITIAEIANRFWKHAVLYYRHADGTPSHEQSNFRQALRPLTELLGRSKAAAFGPRQLKVVRQRMIDRGWCRSNVNKQIGRIKRVFRWAVENEFVPASVYHGVATVSGLKRGRSDARESEPVKPVSPILIQAVRPFVSRQVWGMIELQVLTAARSGEVVSMRAIDIDTSGRIWVYEVVPFVVEA